MKVITTPPRYKCDICGFEHDTEELALLCESFQLEQNDRIQIGDAVLVPTRYDGYVEDYIVDIRIYNKYRSSLEKYKDILKNPDNGGTHGWLYETEEDHQINKDGQRTKYWAEDNLINLSRRKWRTDIENMNGKCVVRYLSANIEHTTFLDNTQSERWRDEKRPVIAWSEL